MKHITIKISLPDSLYNDYDYLIDDFINALGIEDIDITEIEMEQEQC